MPIHEYECRKCGDRTEVLQKANDKPLEKCPKCGGPVAKLISSPAIQFKGKGWYITDYAKKGSTGAGTASEAGPKAETPSGPGEAAKEKAEKAAPADKSGT
jgi:putative FmdB family regulatory protein